MKQNGGNIMKNVLTGNSLVPINPPIYGQFRVPYTPTARKYIIRLLTTKKCGHSLAKEQKMHRKVFICLTFTPKINFIFNMPNGDMKGTYYSTYKQVSVKEFIEILDTLQDKNAKF